MHRETLAYIAIGSNIEPLQRIPRCLTMLGEIPRSHLVTASSWYLTSPWGIEEQADFVNLVVGLATGLSAEKLLRETQAIESRLDRVRNLRNGPRTIDLDILLYGQAQIQIADLTIPHPGLLERDFMLLPLIEIAPQAVHPQHGRPVDELTSGIQYRQILRRIQPTGGRLSGAQ
jgi:2-amino-4-hydroxy-6-hydroxymethyldihydropteridine diphosphokinase